MGTTVKMIFVSGVLTLSLWASGDVNLEQNCLQCHKEQQIPSGLIYKRYLMKYSTPDRIENAMFAYIKNPSPAHSIMPPQFFLKFPMKPPMHLDDEIIHRDIQAYIEKFDVKKRLILRESPL